jgi:general secretion pathway protein G
MHDSDVGTCKRRDSEAGFTLIELMIVVAIIAILAGILIPNFINARAQAQTSACESNLRAIATAAELYYADQQQYPGGGSTINANSTSFTPTGGSTYLNNTPRDPADPGATGFYTFTDKSSAGNPAYVVSCPGQHMSQTLAKLQGWTSGDLYIKYDSGTGLLATGTKNDTGL